MVFYPFFIFQILLNKNAAEKGNKEYEGKGTSHPLTGGPAGLEDFCYFPTHPTFSNIQLRDQCNLLLADFDKQCENLKAEAVREAKAAADSIATLYRFIVITFISILHLL